MEKITSWIWNKGNDLYSEDSFHYNSEDKTIIVKRGDGSDLGDEPQAASEWMTRMEKKGRNKLVKHHQVLYDFLKAKGF